MGVFYSSQIIGLWERSGNEIDRAGIILAPLVNFQITDIDIDTGSYESFNTASTTFTSSQVLFNDTSTSQTSQIGVAYTEESSFSNTYSETSGITETNWRHCLNKS